MTPDQLELRFSRRLVKIIAAGGVVAGFILIAFGLLTLQAHLRCEARVTGLADARRCIEVLYWPFPTGAVAILVSALIIQLGDVTRALTVARDMIPLVGAFGKRATDYAAPAPTVPPDKPAVPVLPDEKGLG